MRILFVTGSLVHGGAACSIAAPTAPIAPELNRVVYGGEVSRRE